MTEKEPAPLYCQAMAVAAGEAERGDAINVLQVLITLVGSLILELDLAERPIRRPTDLIRSKEKESRQ